MDNKRYAAQVWKCLPIYDSYGKESYEKYLFKTIMRMSKESDLNEIESRVLGDLKGLLEVNDIADKNRIRSVILDCSDMLYSQK